MAFTKAEKAKMERKLADVYKECVGELDAIGVPYGTVTEVTVNYRAKSRWGQCVRDNARGTFTINIRCDLLMEYASEKGLKETILHELIHTCPHCMNHGPEWVKWVELVNDCYAYAIKRANTAEDKGMAAEYYEAIKIEREQKRMNAKYRFHCRDCGQVIVRTRRSQFTEWYMLYTCGRQFVRDRGVA